MILPSTFKLISVPMTPFLDPRNGFFLGFSLRSEVFFFQYCRKAILLCLTASLRYFTFSCQFCCVLSFKYSLKALLFCSDGIFPCGRHIGYVFIPYSLLFLREALVHNVHNVHNALYDSELSGVFNRHVPIKKRTVTIRPAAPWYPEELKSEKRGKRRLERRWRVSRSMRDREAYIRQCKVLKDQLSSSRSNYQSNLVAENLSNIRLLFAVFSKLLHRRHEAKMPKA